MRWRDRLRLLGEAGLKVGSSPGRPPRLSAQQRKRLLTDLLKGPGAFGWRTEVWTTARIAQLITPELNPDEGAWGLLKGSLASGRPDDIDDWLRISARSSE